MKSSVELVRHASPTLHKSASQQQDDHCDTCPSTAHDDVAELTELSKKEAAGWQDGKSWLQMLHDKVDSMNSVKVADYIASNLHWQLKGSPAGLTHPQCDGPGQGLL